MAASKAPRPPYFWGWIKNTLRWPLARVPGPIACVVEGCARAADIVLTDIHWLVDQFNPATCAPEYVDRFGAARGLQRHYKETAEKWRRRVCAAYAWHKLAGRTMGMPKILAHFGYEGAVLINLADEGKPDQWAHFRAQIGTGQYPVSDDDWELIRWILNSTKPAKSILDSITVVVRPRATARVAAVCLSGETTTILPWSPPVLTPQPARLIVATGWQATELGSIYPKGD